MPFVLFQEAGGGGVLAKISGKVSFPDKRKWNKARPKPGEIWDVEVTGQNKKETVNFLAPVRKLGEAVEVPSSLCDWAEEHWGASALVLDFYNQATARQTFVRVWARPNKEEAERQLAGAREVLIVASEQRKAQEQTDEEARKIAALAAVEKHPDWKTVVDEAKRAEGKIRITALAYAQATQVNVESIISAFVPPTYYASFEVSLDGKVNRKR